MLLNQGLYRSPVKVYKEDIRKEQSYEPQVDPEVDKRRKYYKNLGIAQKGSKEHEKLVRGEISRMTSNITYLPSNKEVCKNTFYIDGCYSHKSENIILIFGE